MIQDGAESHNSKLALCFLEDMFGPEIISQNTTDLWTSHCPNFRPPDFMLCRSAQNKEFKRKPEKISHLRDVKELLYPIAEQTLINAANNVTK